MFNIVQCENCEGVIFPKQVEIKDEPLKPGIQLRHWSCPHCNHKHIILLMDKVSRRMMKDNRRDRERIGGIHRRAKSLGGTKEFNESKARSFLDQVEKIQKRIDKRTAQLDERSKKIIYKYVS